MKPGAVGQGESQTLTSVTAGFEADGYTGQFRPAEDGTIQCLTCRETAPAEPKSVDHLRRLEGASDPADMAVVIAMRCPRCDVRGTLVAMFGPEASADDADVLAALGDAEGADPGEPRRDGAAVEPPPT